MADVLIFQTDDGGEITIENGEVTLTDGPESAVYLSLFGGNDDDPGLSGNTEKTWWGNLVEGNEARRYRSRTQYLLETLPPTSGNLRRFEDAVKTDLAWMATELGAELAASASLPSLNRVELAIRLDLDGRRYEFKIAKVWQQ